MRGIITTSLAAVLSLLMLSTSVFTSACDLSCWLRQAHSGCHTVRSSISGEDTAMSMSSEMDMGSDHGGSMMRPDTSVDGMPVHSMSMPPPIEGVITERFEHSTKPEMGKNAMLDRSKGPSSCAHEPCSQFSAFGSPQTGEHSQLDSLHRLAVFSRSNSVNIWMAFHSIRPDTSPPKILVADRPLTALRI